MALTCLQKKAVCWWGCMCFPCPTSLTPPPRPHACNCPLSLFQSFPIQWVTAINSETLSHLNKIRDPNTLIPTTDFFWLPYRIKPTFKNYLILLFYFLTSHFFFLASSWIHYFTETNNLSLADIIYLCFYLLIVHLPY